MESMETLLQVWEPAGFCEARERHPFAAWQLSPGKWPTGLPGLLIEQPVVPKGARLFYLHSSSGVGPKEGSLAPQEPSAILMTAEGKQRLEWSQERLSQGAWGPSG